MEYSHVSLRSTWTLRKGEADELNAFEMLDRLVLVYKKNHLEEKSDNCGGITEIK